MQGRRNAPRETEPKCVPHDQTVLEIVFDYKVKLLFAFLALYLLFATCFSINGSSVGIWNALSDRNIRSNVLLGTPKYIRMDEWAIHTPAILAQCNSKNPFPTENYSLGGFKAPLVMNVPVKHFSTLLRPQFWLFFLADSERAYAFYWNAKLVCLISGVFLLLMLLLENNFVLSLFGASWVYFSGYVQWWYSSPAEWPELVGFSTLFTAAFIQILVVKKKIKVVLFSLVFLMASFNFVICLYPPHQVPLVYLSCCIIIGLLLPRYKTLLSELSLNRFRLGCIILTSVLTAGLLFLFYCDAKQTLSALANTAYPGLRRSSGGEVSIIKIFSGFFGLFMSEWYFPKSWGNISESSNFLLFFPIPMFLMWWEWLRRRRVFFVDAMLCIYITVILLWLIWGFPEFLARVTLFNRVASTRAFLSLGLASIIWTCFLLHKIAESRSVYTYTLKFKLSISAIMLLGVLIHAHYFNVITEGFASVFEIAMVCAFVTMAAFLMIYENPLPFIGLILVANIWAYGLVNPICMGLKPILEQPIYERIGHIVRHDPETKMIIYNTSGFPLAQLAYAAGARVFNGLKYVPNLIELKDLSANSNDFEIYNRYAYVYLIPIKGPEITFSSLQADLYQIYVDP